MPAKESLEEMQRCVDLYLGGMNTRDVAKVTNHSPQSITTWIRRLGYQVRTVAASKRLKPKRRLASLNADGILSKFCSKCDLEKPVTEFGEYAGGLDGHRNVCNSCRAPHRRAHYQRHRTKILEKGKRLRKENPRLVRDKDLRARFKITIEEFEQRFLDQGSKCAGCGTTDPGSKSWMMDHDHSCCPSSTTCGKCLRAVLCQGCNSALGHAKDNPKRLRDLADYVERHQLPYPGLQRAGP